MTYLVVEAGSDLPVKFLCAHLSYLSYAQSKIACVPFAQSRKRNQKVFADHYGGDPLATCCRNKISRPVGLFTFYSYRLLR
ncbi:hypothetical protein CLV62_1539 [Dysgonomonas alginatilytica]|uniref:Uncharacterized protein n=1 Tax=Dysgonomonas alginatilytica TaxID=1605892 RepID=A0A2V3PJV9_9BACT|nr:hypothetical protein CLV62_1539 [Dysgonomonas alginatilytica]